MDDKLRSIVRSLNSASAEITGEIYGGDYSQEVKYATLEMEEAVANLYLKLNGCK